MGRVKEFSMWIEECAYQRDMNDAQIISAATSHWSVSDQDKDWLLEQIRVVRSNPHIYPTHTSPKKPIQLTDANKEA